MAILEPVKVAGSTISKTTLHNEDFIKQKRVKNRRYSYYTKKAGDVIPEIVEVKKIKGQEKKLNLKCLKNVQYVEQKQ